MLPDYYHQNASKSSVVWSYLPPVVAFLVVALISPLHVLVLSRFWDHYTRVVDKRTCTCSCWDTVFKGPYESGIASYKHFYFNATTNTFKIWLLLIFFVVLLHKCITNQVELITKGQLRYEMGFLFMTSLFSHYYSFWGYVNYYNDEFYSQWNHQLFFTLTELVSTFAVLRLSNSTHVISTRCVFVVTGVALLHILAGGWDQFYTNVVRGEGYSHQVIRDICFMVPDVLHLIIPPLSLRARVPRATRLGSRTLRELALTLLFVSVGFIVASFL